MKAHQRKLANTTVDAFCRTLESAGYERCEGGGEMAVVLSTKRCYIILVTQGHLTGSMSIQADGEPMTRTRLGELTLAELQILKRDMWGKVRVVK